MEGEARSNGQSDRSDAVLERGVDGETLPDRPPRREVAPVVFALTYLIPAFGLINAPGGTYEEGIMLNGAERVAGGSVPHRDFFSLYGPLATWVPGQVVRIFGVSQLNLRLMGLVLCSLLVWGTYRLSRLVLGVTSRVPLVVLAITGILMAGTQVVLPVAWWLGVTCLVWGLVAMGRFAPVAGEQGDGPRIGGHVDPKFAAAAALVVVSIGFRPELVVAAGGVLLVYATRTRPRPWASLAAGGVVGSLPLAVHTLIVGPSELFHWLVYVPVVQLRPFRRLPVPPSWGEFDASILRLMSEERFIPINPLTGPNQLSLWFWFGCLAPILAAVALWLGRSRASAVGGAPYTTLLAWTLVAFATLPQLVQRADLAHVFLVTVLSTPLLITTLAWAMDQQQLRIGGLRPLTLSIMVVALLMLAIAPDFVLRRWLDSARFRPSTLTGEVVHNGRSFGILEVQAAPLRDAVQALAAQAAPGDTLITGPGDIGTMKQNDMAVYYLFPELKPGTYFVEVNPGVTNEPGSGFAEDLKDTDWLLLSRFSDGWDEPNRSRDVPDPSLQRIVDEEFCRIELNQDVVELYQRCG